MTLKIVLLAIAVALLGALLRPVSLLKEATGAAAQTVCSKGFVSGLSPDAVLRDHLLPEPGVRLIAWAMQVDVDHKRRDVRARVFGSFESHAVFRAGRGCTLVYAGGPAPSDLPPPQPLRTPSDVLEAGHVGGNTDPRLTAAVDKAFAEPASGAPRNTLAVVVVHKGRVIAERYAAGIGPDTPLLTHSVAKSIVNALVGILVRQGKLRIDDRVAIPAWRDDARGAITIDDLLRMQAGFGFDEGAGASQSTSIWFTEPDMAQAASSAALVMRPGESWGYCSRCYILLSRIIGQAIGGGVQGLRDFAERELFAPLGMSSVVAEFDEVGTLMGANAMFATPRDLARFGMLYLHDGVVGGRRILPEGWVKYSTRPTLDSGYGAGFWLNTTQASISEWRMNWGIPGAPTDAFMARGYMGQYIVVVPSAALVVVRMGQSHARAMEMTSVAALVTDLVSLLR